jgi:aryl-alcohol dehydrogenase-like predicted oxidoreductase
MSVFAPAPKPKTHLGYHRILAPSAGLRVSPLCLGAMNFGDAWKGFMGECDKETTFGILDHFYENGGNFIDTANNYQNEESEKWIGEWMEERGVRDQMVVATKVGLRLDIYPPSGYANCYCSSPRTTTRVQILRRSRATIPETTQSPCSSVLRLA